MAGVTNPQPSNAPTQQQDNPYQDNSSNSIPQQNRMSARDQQNPYGGHFQEQQNSLENADMFSDQKTIVNGGQDNEGADDFMLMDIVGGGCVRQSNLSNASKSVATMHPTKPIVAYTAGCMIIVYDLMSDSKVNLVGHQHDVFAIKFTPNGESLMSVDFNQNAELQDSQGPKPTSQIFLWDWQKGCCIQETSIPRSQNLSMILAPTSASAGISQIQSNMKDPSDDGCHIQLSFDKTGTLFMVLESSPLKIGGGYRVTLWSCTKYNVIEMISSMDLELQCPCIDLAFLPRSQHDMLNAQRSAGQSNHSAQVFLNSRLPFMTVEKNCIKLWEYSQGNAQLKKRIHIKQSIAQIHIAELTNFFLILGENGKMLILDMQGEFVSTVQKEGIQFTTVGTAHDKLLMGTNRGSVHVYHLASLQFISEIPYQLSFLQKFSLNSETKNTIDHEQLSLSKIGPPVNQVWTTLNLRFLWIQYSDGSFAVVDRTIMNPRQAILGYSCGHFECISGLQWINQKTDGLSDRNSIYKDLYGHDSSIQNQSAAADQQFVTCSHDLSIHVWKHYGDRWAFSYIDVAKSFDQALNFQRKQCDGSTREMLLTALCLYPRSNNLLVADSKGFVRVFQLVSENAHLIATHRLARSQEIKAERAMNINHNPAASRLGNEQEFADDHIKQIFITQNENTAVVTFNSGLISLYDVKNGFSYIGDAVDTDFQRFNTQTSHAGSTIKIIEVQQPSSSAGGMDLIGRATRSNGFAQDEHPAYLSDAGLSHNRNMSNMSSQLYGSHSCNLKILSLTSPNQVSMQLVDVKGTKLTRSPLCQYVISEGKVTGFDIHPSKDYLLVTSSKGRIYVFRIDTGELRGTIKIPLNANGCLVDPSGLYVIFKVPAFANQNAVNLMEGSISHASPFGANEKDLARNTILMYEIGTGIPAAEICSVFEISQMQFSQDGRYLTLGSTSGAVSVWSMSNHLHQNIKQVLDAMKIQNDFWFNYPIFLPDYELFNQGDQQQQHFYTLGQNQTQSEQPSGTVSQGFIQQQDSNVIRPPQFSAKQLTQAVHQSHSQTFSQDNIQGSNQNIPLQHTNSFPQAHQQQQQQFQQPHVQQQPSQNYQAEQQQYHSPPQTQQQWQQQQQMAPQYQTQQPYQQQHHGGQQNQTAPLPTQARNEQRFLRNSFAEVPNARALADQQMREQQQYQQQQNMQSPHSFRGGDQQQNLQQPPPVQTPVKPSQQQVVASQMQQTNSLYANPNVSLPPVYAPQQTMSNQAQQPQHSYSNSQPGFDGQQNQQLWQGGSQPQLHFASGMSSRRDQQHQPPQQQQQWGGQQQQSFAQPAHQRPPSLAVAPIPNYQPAHQQQNQNQQRPLQHQFTQDQAIATLQGLNQDANQTSSGGIIDLNEPSPINQSQLLYNQPLNATVNRKEGAHNGSFIQYRDENGFNGIANQTTPPRPMYQLPGYNQESVQRGVFDNTLNDRDTNGMTQTHTTGMNATNGGAANNNEISPYVNVQQNPTQHQSPTIGQVGPHTGGNADNSFKATGTKLFTEPVEKKDDAAEYQPLGFTNQKTQGDILRGIKPDPHDIDGGMNASTKKGEEAALGGSATNEMMAELDGMNKYLQGVKMPQAIGVGKNMNGSFTLKEMRNQEKQREEPSLGKQSSVSPLQKLYGGSFVDGPQTQKIDVPPNNGTPSQSDGPKKSRNSDLVDDMYQSIDDFENKLRI